MAESTTSQRIIDALAPLPCAEACTAAKSGTPPTTSHDPGSSHIVNFATPSTPRVAPLAVTGVSKIKPDGNANADPVSTIATPSYSVVRTRASKRPSLLPGATAPFTRTPYSPPYSRQRSAVFVTSPPAPSAEARETVAIAIVPRRTETSKSAISPAGRVTSSVEGPHLGGSKYPAETAMFGPYLSMSCPRSRPNSLRPRFCTNLTKSSSPGSPTTPASPRSISAVSSRDRSTSGHALAPPVAVVCPQSWPRFVMTFHPLASVLVPTPPESEPSAAAFPFFKCTASATSESTSVISPSRSVADKTPLLTLAAMDVAHRGPPNPGRHAHVHLDSSYVPPLAHPPSAHFSHPLSPGTPSLPGTPGPVQGAGHLHRPVSGSMTPPLLHLGAEVPSGLNMTSKCASALSVRCSMQHSLSPR